MKINSNNFFGLLGLLLSVSVFSATAVKAQELPEPSHENIRTAAYSELDIRREMDKMIAQLGEGNLYHQYGSSGIYGGYSMTERACRLSKEKGMRLGIIVGTQTHTNSGYFATLNQNIRAFENFATVKSKNSNSKADLVYWLTDKNLLHALITIG